MAVTIALAAATSESHLPMHLAYVTPRYGAQVIGGAELGVRMFAERLVARFGWQVDVLTTRALDLRTWANELPGGSQMEDGVCVHRFATTEPRHPDFDARSGPLLARPHVVDPRDAQDWIRWQGPHSPELLDAIASSPADLVVFYPYLYEPTVVGIASVRERAVMHPAAHDEPPIRLPVFRDVFAAARGLVFQTYAEAAFVSRLFRLGATAQIILGLGSDPQPGESAPARAEVGVGDRPYLLAVGRVDDGKGTGVLARYFMEYKNSHPGPLALVLAGPVVHAPPAHPDVIATGVVDEATKWGLLRDAVALVQPSGFEAFSLVLVEAWHAARPVLVNARCFATREHCERSGGGLWFDGYPAFEVSVDRLLAAPNLRQAMGAAGREYVQREFTWPLIIDRYRAFLERVAR